jgi:hypothetical protein
MTIVNRAGTLQRYLDACGRPAWEVTREDVDRVVGGFAAQGPAASTRRGYVQAFKNFHALLTVRRVAAIEAAFGVRLEDPVDEFNAARHVSADSPSASPPPDPARLEDIFGLAFDRKRSFPARINEPASTAVSRRPGYRGTNRPDLHASTTGRLRSRIHAERRISRADSGLAATTRAGSLRRRLGQLQRSALRGAH